MQYLLFTKIFKIFLFIGRWCKEDFGGEESIYGSQLLIDRLGDISFKTSLTWWWNQFHLF